MLVIEVEQLRKTYNGVAAVDGISFKVGKALRDVAMDTVKWQSLGMDALVLGAWAIGCLLLAFKFFRWE